MDPRAPAPPAPPALDPELVRAVESALRQEELRLEVAGPGDFAAVEAMANRADPSEVRTPLDAALIGWFTEANPAGRGFLVVARARETGEVVGHFLFYPKRLWCRPRPGAEARPVTTYLFVRLLVDAAFRRRGVFAAMTGFGLELLRRSGVGFAYTVPNQRSAPGFLRHGLRELGRLPFRARPAWRLWPRLVFGSPSGIEVESRDAFDATFDDEIDRSMSAETLLWGDRSAPHLNWRFSERPDARYAIRYAHQDGEPVGYLVTRVMRIGGYRALAVCDAWFRAGAEAAMAVAIHRAIRAAAAERIDLAVAIGGSPDGRIARWLRRAGFVRLPQRLLPQPVAVLGGHFAPPVTTPGILDTGTWYVTPYDWDVF